MTQLLSNFRNDENGFLVSAELVLVATIAVLGLVVGLSEVASGVNEELEDVASAFGTINQSFCFSGQKACKSHAAGSGYTDDADQCDDDCDITVYGDISEGGRNY